jgi:drug/metabolite transporter (DMT)-like permease
VFWFSLIAVILCGTWQLATSRFHALNWHNGVNLLGMGACATAAQLAMTRAYRTGNTLVVSALSYSTLVFGSIATFLVWGDRIEAVAWLGMAIIVASGIIATRVEKKEQAEEAGFES